MSGFGILMLIFGIITLLVGLYMFTGHEFGIMTERPSFKNLKKDEWIKIGKYTMVVSIFILILGIMVTFMF